MGARPEVRSLTIVSPSTTVSLPEAWREGTAKMTADAVLLCTGPADLGDVDRHALLAASADADAVLGISATDGIGLLVRSGDIADLMLLRNRGTGAEAVRDALSRLRQTGRSVARVTMSSSRVTRAAAPANWIGTAGRRLVEQAGRVGFAAGFFSRTHRNLEVWRTHRASPGIAQDSRCPSCGAGSDSQMGLHLQTSADLRDFGAFGAVLCTRCEVARTDPAPHELARVITPDVQGTTRSVAQRALMRRFVRTRVERVRPHLPADHRPRVADIGGGACAFANALGATGCDVIVFEPNAANGRFADPAVGVQFVPAPFDERAVATAGIADDSLDGITMWHALEHVPNPAATLALARRLLRPGGVLYVCVPNLDSLQADVGGTHWCYADIPHHVTHFSLEGLATVMRRAGFSQLAPHWWSAEYALFGWYQTLLNLLTGSHNFFYNRAKKGRTADAGPHPAWTRVATALGPLLLPIVMIASFWETAASKPACAELHGIAS